MAPCVAPAPKGGATLPWSVHLDVHWGARKNREAYRSEFERALRTALSESACFSAVVPADASDLVLDVQIEEFRTEQEFRTAESILPGVLEEPMLLRVRVRITLDYSLRPDRPGAEEVAGGRFARDRAREPNSPKDTVEERALRELTQDAAHWVVRELCDGRKALGEKLRRALDPPRTPAPESAPGKH